MPVRMEVQTHGTRGHLLDRRCPILPKEVGRMLHPSREDVKTICDPSELQRGHMSWRG